MFGNHGRKEQGYEGNIRTRGGLMYYQTDALGNVMDVTDHIGDTVMKYRYDAFSNLFTQMAAPYNSTGYTGKSYDAKAGLMDYSARWYSLSTGRFTSEDTFLGWMEEPLSLNKYSYVHNNPVNYIDPTGHWQEGDENLSQDAQDRIRDLTDQWYNAGTQEERDRIHQEAEDIRNGNNGSNGNSNGSSGGNYSRSLEDILADLDGQFHNEAGDMPSIDLSDYSATYSTLEALLDMSSTNGKGVMGIYYEVELTGIVGVHANVGYFIDTEGNKLDTLTIGSNLKTNIEAVGSANLIYYPDMENVNQLLGGGVYGGIEGGLENL